MVILAQRWAEAFTETHPEASVQVSGGGSGTGVAALVNRTIDVALSSRPVSERERRSFRRAGRPAPVETPVALDAVAVYVHADNPIASLSLGQLADIYRGRVRRWEALGGSGGAIVLYSRENSSGTYAFFKARALGGQDFAPGTQTLSGTAAVIHAVSRDRAGIGYGGIGHGRGVRAIPIAPDEGVAVAPSLEEAVSGRYPLARPLFLVTAGPPEGQAATLLEWVLSPAGQSLVETAGYYPLPAQP